ncbi:RNA-binding domain-containing protein [Ramicandelaber brevisporus]|nr:RNA-binding domain-containing protein [Ramicandelaber brevisporus]
MTSRRPRSTRRPYDYGGSDQYSYHPQPVPSSYYTPDLQTQISSYAYPAAFQAHPYAATTIATEKQRQRPPPNTTPNRTVYAQNLNETVKSDVMSNLLRAVFEECGEVIQVNVSNKTMRRRGQAWIVFRDIEAAAAAISELNGFTVLGRQLYLQFANEPSVVSIDGDEATVDEFRRSRRDAKLERRKAKQQYKEELAELEIAEAKKAEEEAAQAAAAAAAYIPPHELNKTLFVQNIPTKLAGGGGADTVLQSIFGEFSGLVEVRLIPFRPDIAFVEYTDEQLAYAALLKLNGTSITDTEDVEHKLKVEFAKK